MKTGKIQIGLLIGIISGIIDVIPMIIQGLTWDANLSAFTMWVIVGLLLAMTDINVKGILKGLLISLMVLVPNLFIIGWKEPVSIIPIIIMTAILGSLSGLVFQKLTSDLKN